MIGISYILHCYGNIIAMVTKRYLNIVSVNFLPYLTTIDTSCFTDLWAVDPSTC